MRLTSSGILWAFPVLYAGEKRHLGLLGAGERLVADALCKNRFLYLSRGFEPLKTQLVAQNIRELQLAVWQKSV